jgi:hypothetical protein
VGDDQHERIEIELTPHAPDGGEPRRRWRARRQADDRAVPTPAPPHPSEVVPGPGDRAEPGGADRGDVEPEEGVSDDARSPIDWLAGRGRTTVVAGAVGVVALLLGWMLGRSGGEDAPAVADTSPVLTDPQGPDDPAIFDDAEDLPGADIDLGLPTTVEPRPPRTTTTLPAEVEETVDIVPELAGVELQLVGLTRDGRLVDLDVATGAQRVRAPEERLSLEGERIFAGSDWVAIPSFDRPGLRIVRDDGSVERFDLDDPWNVIVDTTTDTFWTGASGNPFMSEMQEIDVTGVPTGRAVTLPPGAWPITSDRGALVVQATGSLYRVEPDSSELLARGELVGLSADVVATYSCDDSLTCGAAVTDRVTGETRPVPATDDNDDVLAATRFGPGFGGDVSPDGRWAPGARYDDFGFEFGVLDLESGEFTLLPTEGALPYAGWAWSPDGRFLVYARSDRLAAFDTSTGEAIDVVADPSVRWVTVAARPAGPTSVAVEETGEG